MSVLVDTSVWSLALRRKKQDLGADEQRLVAALNGLIVRARVHMIGPVRQELLSGISEPAAYERLRNHLRAFPDFVLDTFDFELAAELSNRCRKAGLQGSHTDFLLCAVAERHSMEVFSADKDFAGFARVLSVRLFAHA
jgi:predicted nucleic acid-binding protein